MIVTNHAEDRRKRLGLNKKCFHKKADEALNYGVKHRETKGSLKRYLDYEFLKYQTATNMRIYQRMLYIFEKDKLVTEFHLPQKYHKTADKLQKRKGENYSDISV